MSTSAAPSSSPPRVSPWVERLVELTENRFSIPGTDKRFGFDALLGLIPGIGDALGLVIGTAVVWEALRLKLPAWVLGRMMMNLLIDSMVGSVPVVGDLFDFYFRANKRNLRLLRRVLEDRADRPTMASAA